jgi:DNA invertase Pin-like site-specific DNA recombinase
MARKSRRNLESSYDTQLAAKTWRTAIYARLSKEQNETETIETQIEEVAEFLKKRHVFNVIDVYADNGYSGANFERPQFERLMEDIRNRQIDCIAVKDLSRFAREHINAEDYLNNIFPFLGIRFIAVRDNYDNLNIKPQEYFMASFKNFANAYFAKETSRKVSEAKRILQEQGKYVGAFAPYGYLKNPENKYSFIIDDKKAEIVREVFRRYANGESWKAIAKDFNARGVATSRGGVWHPARIRDMLDSEAYIGTLVQHKTTKSLYRNEAFSAVSKDEQIRFENAFPAIIERELWDKVREQRRLRANKNQNDRKALTK